MVSADALLGPSLVSNSAPALPGAIRCRLVPTSQTAFFEGHTDKCARTALHRNSCTHGHLLCMTGHGGNLRTS
eukprot:1763994-Amphidinium_carterae.5